jgi:hypothetical protein
VAAGCQSSSPLYFKYLLQIQKKYFKVLQYDIEEAKKNTVKATVRILKSAMDAKENNTVIDNNKGI